MRIKWICKDLCVAWMSHHPSASSPSSVPHKILQFLSAPASLSAAVEESCFLVCLSPLTACRWWLINLTRPSSPIYTGLSWACSREWRGQWISVLSQPSCLWSCFSWKIFGRAFSSVSAHFRLSMHVLCCQKDSHLTLKWPVRWLQWKPQHVSWWCCSGRRGDKGTACSSLLSFGTWVLEMRTYRMTVLGGERGTDLGRYRWT